MGRRLHILAARQEVLPGCQPRRVGTPTDDQRHAGHGRRSQSDLGSFRADEQQAGAGVRQDVGKLLGREVEVDRDKRDPGMQTREVGLYGLSAVVGKHTDPLIGLESER